MKFAAWYYLSVGVLMITQWIFFLATGSVPELRTEPLRIAFHLAAEFVTAASLIVSAAGLFNKKTWGRAGALVAGGMLAYTAMVSPGYFAQQNQWPLVGMFIVLLVLDGVSISKALRSVELPS